MPKIHQTTESTVTGPDGRTVSRVNRVLSWGSEPAFVKLYLQDVLYLSDMPKHHEKILYELLRRATYAGEKSGMQVSLSAGTKRLICKELDLKNIRTINNVLTDLVRGKILYRVETGVYNFNPYLFGKGDWADIARLRLQVDYDDIKGKTFQTVCEYKGQIADLKSQVADLSPTGTEGKP